MKKILFALTVLVAANTAFANVPADSEISTLAEITMTRLNETRYIIKDRGYCDEYEGRIECVWEIEDTGRTNDTMHGVFTSINGEFILVEAYEEYGC